MRGNIRRSRDGCWTCRKRKKKCGGERPSCHNCESLKVHCDGYSQRILWEDDEPRAGMRRRGPAKKMSQKIAKKRANVVSWMFEPQITAVEEITPCDEIVSSEIGVSNSTKSISSNEDDVDMGSRFHGIFDMGSKLHRKPRSDICVNDLLPSSPVRFISPHPLDLTALQSLFLDHYLSNFSLKYPTFLDPSNPFLSTLVPLALRNTTVLSAVLAIGGIQTGLEGRPDVKTEILALKGRTLRGCRKLLHTSDVLDPLDGYGQPSPAWNLPGLLGNTLLGNIGNRPFKHRVEEDDLMLFASVMLLMVHDKLSGEPCSNLRPHLMFAHHFERRTVIKSLVSVHYKFLRNIFLYNDLLASIASGSPTLRDYGQNTTGSVQNDSKDDPDGSLDEEELSMSKFVSNRFYLPILLSRIANRSNGVTLADIERWDGNMTWLPSFSSIQMAEATHTVKQQSPFEVIADEFENKLISEIYRNAARVFYLQRLRKHTKGFDKEAGGTTVASYDCQIQNFNYILISNLRSLPLGSVYESSLLFPIGIAAMEIHDVGDKAYVLSRLQHLEDRFQLDHFRKFKEKISAFWEGNEARFAEQQFACDAILLG